MGNGKRNLGGAKTVRGNFQMIKNIEDYKELAVMVDTAEECLQSLRYGSHWLLRVILKQKYDIDVADRLDAIKQARKLCNEFMDALTYDDALQG